MRNALFLFASLLIILSCKKEDTIVVGAANCGEENALVTCLSPTQTPEYYIEQGVKYFRTMESSVPITVQPNYSELVIRWEWPPWLLLTGIGREMMVWTDIILKLNPTKYDLIDCRFFDEQPFCRCHVIFNYSGEPCPIYEEFCFNDKGEITFIEAWSDFESLLPMGPGEDGVWDYEDYWAMGDNVDRLSTRVPGLGNAEGKVRLKADWMEAAMEVDADLEDMVTRGKDPYNTWLEQLRTHSEELDGGCFAPDGDVYPYYVE